MFVDENVLTTVVKGFGLRNEMFAEWGVILSALVLVTVAFNPPPYKNLLEPPPYKNLKSPRTSPVCKHYKYRQRGNIFEGKCMKSLISKSAADV